MAKDYLPGTFKDVVTTPLGHDSKQELGSEYGIVKIGLKEKLKPFQVKQCQTSQS